MPVGSNQTITAVYSGDAKYATSNGVVPGGFTVSATSTTTTVTALPTTTVFGQSVTFKATVGAQSPGVGTPSTIGDTVTFYDGPVVPANAIGTSSLVGGVATLAYSQLPANTYNINAVFNPAPLDTNFLASTGMLSNFIVGQASSQTALTAAPTSTVFGQPVLFSATVSAVFPGAGLPFDGDTVTYYDGAVLPADIIGTGTTNAAGVATLSTSILAVGSHTITASFGGDSNFLGSSGSIANFQVSIAGTTTTVSAIPTSGDVYGESVTLTAAVTANTPSVATVNGGIVSFYNGPAVPADLLGTGTVSGNSATLITTMLPVSTDVTITAVYGGTASFTNSTGTLTNYAVAQAGTTTVVTAAPSSGDVFGQSITFTATVTANAPSAVAVAGGTVSFYNGAAIPADLLGTGAVVAGVATASSTALPVNGNLTIMAVYAGNTDFGASTGTLTNYAVAQDGSVTTVTAAPGSAFFGQSVTFTATITAAVPGSGTPSGGTVNFYNGTAIPANLLGSGTVVAGVATYSTASLPVNANTTITAQFLGNTNFITSTGALSPFAVNPANTTTTVAAAPGGTVFGQSVTFTATVLAAAPGAGTVSSGTVNFYDGTPILANLIGTGTVSAGTATFTTTALPVNAAHTITAVYQATTDFNSSTGTLTNFAVGQASTTTAVTSVPGSTVFGQSVTFTATISPVAPGAGAPNSGTVNFYDGAPVAANLIGSGTVSGGVAMFATTTLPVNANHTITAVFSGNASFITSTGTLTHYVVSAASTSTSVAANPSSGDVFGQTVTLTATVSSPTATVNGGTVSFYNGTPIPANLLGTSTAVAGGSASITTTALPVNANLTLTAFYTGTGNFITSTGTLNNSAVAQALTTTTVAASPASGDVFGESVTFTATVLPVSPSTVTIGEGTVNFYNGAAVPANLLGTGNVSGGTATFTTTALPVNPNDTINAVYADAAGNYVTSTGTLGAYAVAEDSTTVTVSAAPTSTVFGQSVTFIALVGAATPGSGTPASGTVMFYDGRGRSREPHRHGHRQRGRRHRFHHDAAGQRQSHDHGGLLRRWRRFPRQHRGADQLRGRRGQHRRGRQCVPLQRRRLRRFGDVHRDFKRSGARRRHPQRRHRQLLRRRPGRGKPAGRRQRQQWQRQRRQHRAGGGQPLYHGGILRRRRRLPRQHRHSSQLCRGPGRHQHVGQRDPGQRRRVRRLGHADGQCHQHQQRRRGQRRHRQLLSRLGQRGELARRLRHGQRRQRLDRNGRPPRGRRRQHRRRLWQCRQLQRQHGRP